MQEFFSFLLILFYLFIYFLEVKEKKVYDLFVYTYTSSDTRQAFQNESCEN